MVAERKAAGGRKRKPAKKAAKEPEPAPRKKENVAQDDAPVEERPHHRPASAAGGPSKEPPAEVEEAAKAGWPPSEQPVGEGREDMPLAQPWESKPQAERPRPPQSPPPEVPEPTTAWDEPVVTAEEEDDVWASVDEPEQDAGPMPNVRSVEEQRAEAPSRGWNVAEPPPEAHYAPPEPLHEPAASQEASDLRADYKAASKGRGTPAVAAVGWAIFTIGLLILTYAYWDIYVTNEQEFLSFYGAIRLDVLGLIMMAVGLIMAVAFHLSPPQRSTAPGLDDTGPDDWVQKSRAAHARAVTHRSLAIAGWSVFVLGMLIAVLGFRQAWLESANQATEVGFFVGATFVEVWQVGAFIAAIGLVTFLLTYTRMHNAQQARVAYLLAAIVAIERSATRPVGQQPAAVAQPVREAGVAGVPPERVKAVMRRIDQLLSKLPENEVAEFARSPEAEAYLKILESS